MPILKSRPTTIPMHFTVGQNAGAAVLGLTVSALLVLFFSPSWASFVAWHVEPATYSDLIPVRRGASVAQQVINPSTDIQDPIHKVVRWRLLFPLIGHCLHMSPPLVLALAPLGCIVVLALIVAAAHSRGAPWGESSLLAIVVGAQSWFYTATGWLGYFDSWLVLGLLAIAFARHRSVTWMVCLLTPWVDERVVMGFPLAILVRWLDRDSDMPHRDLLQWCVREALLPAAFLFSFTVLRLYLAGRGGSESVAANYAHVAFTRLPASRLLFGSWEGLRLGWPLVAAAIVLLWRRPNRLAALLLTFATAATMLISLTSANDLSRSMMLVVPVVPLGWALARSTTLWRRWSLGLALAAAALLLPARHVVSTFTIPLNHLSYELRLLADVQAALHAKKGLGVTHAQ